MDDAEEKMLAGLLRRRLEIIADHDLRDADPDGHLDQLKKVSLELSEAHQRVRSQIPPRLDHFLSQCSYQKALDFIEPPG